MFPSLVFPPDSITMPYQSPQPATAFNSSPNGKGLAVYEERDG